ncbi:MAG: hypothetical protein GF317_09945 [Candidatus Lokiarchaeota archaeon]|nr:hypothetical protein [Candidatus Lokiarchaeota archaeon]
MNTKNKAKHFLLQRLFQLSRAIQDDILAEKSAVALYKDHIKSFNKLFLLNSSVLKKVLNEIFADSSKINKYYKKINNWINGNSEVHESIKHIMEEEQEHIIEFKSMLGDLQGLCEEIDSV